MVNKLLGGAGLVLVVALYFAVSFGLDVHADLQQQKFSTQIQERKVSGLLLDSDRWQAARIGLQNTNKQQVRQYRALMREYENVSDKTKNDFLDVVVPADIAGILRNSDASALREYTATTSRPIDPNAISAAYYRLTNSDVYTNREAYIKQLALCNADKAAIYDKYYGQKKPPQK